ncbi:hypothetical protein [Phytoactinopolyspora mesophila]|uniref:DUF2306 domain-containing protein n=1 Tax=Phytoactinopolyspora mesophila TaxID=2650750 RepID=A0A7K3MAA7_9ACTN|nr:hypothetical protein [Phytoactinopolyspora mesophila]NDL60245.1 hypothetical protein [Phytoactinopolyspora mesophila]
MRTALVILHAAPGVAGVLTGLLALSPPRPDDGRRRWRDLYVGCIAILIVGMVALVVYDWAELDTAARVAFAGLGGLAAIMGFRLWRAHREASDQPHGWQRRYIDHVFFTYVSLWIGLLIVPALNTPAPQVAVPIVVLAVLGTGHVLLTRYKRGVLSHDAQPT